MTLLQLIEDYGKQREMSGWVERYEYDMGLEGSYDCEADAHKDTIKEKRKAETILKRIYKLLGVKFDRQKIT